VSAAASSHAVVFCAVPTDFDFESLARDLVGRGLAACVQALPPVRSVYSWKGNVEEASEVLVLIKTRFDRFDAVRDAIRRVHPYETPEIVALPIERGHHPYLDWIDSVLR
jgi:periplasmic divalent cation tolerance protein